MYSRTPYGSDQILQDEVLAASPARLIQILYEGAIQAVSAAMQALEAGDVLARAQKIAKAVAIINELATSLDVKSSGPWARDLVELYDYMARRLNEANFSQRPEPLAEVRKLLSTLLDAWKSADTGAASNVNSTDSVEHIDHFA